MTLPDCCIRDMAISAAITGLLLQVEIENRLSLEPGRSG
jgi:hypothetical protein